MAIHRRPDFIIAGAMKCGTTWLHDALNRLPEIQIPRDEIHWIDARDPIVHPEFPQITNRGLCLIAREETSWFETHTQDTEPGGLLGYDSTTLFHSKIDMGQVAEALPDTKFVVLLRDPVDRAYSHYWHLVRTGRARHRFERELLYGKREIFDRSIYVDQVRRFKLAFDKRVHFVCYERMFADPEAELGAILQFLDLPSDRLATLISRVDVPSNPGRYPRFLGGCLMASRLLAGLERGHYARDVGSDRQTLLGSVRYGAYLGKLGVMAVLAGGVVRSAPPMLPETRQSLAHFLREANSGIEDLLEGSWNRWWYRGE